MEQFWNFVAFCFTTDDSPSRGLKLSFVLISNSVSKFNNSVFKPHSKAMDETTTLQIEAKLERERTNIALLEQNLEKYNSLTVSASNILKNFEQRLLKVNRAS